MKDKMPEGSCWVFDSSIICVKKLTLADTDPVQFAEEGTVRLTYQDTRPRYATA
jgi:hypothetical protein